jgi:hypothetical protein
MKMKMKIKKFPPFQVEESSLKKRMRKFHQDLEGELK